MAKYNIYNNITEGNITTATDSIRKKINKIKTTVGETKTALNEETWKATAKNTLFKAFDTINDEVCKELLAYLDDLDTLAGLIKGHKETQAKAEQFHSEMNAASKENKAYYRNKKEQAESLMTEYEDAIDALKNG